jgi:CheY-like chemotaxis protein
MCPTRRPLCLCGAVRPESLAVILVVASFLQSCIDGRRCPVVQLCDSFISPRGAGKVGGVTSILVVDDERAITDFVYDALTEEGYAVSVCHDGASALVSIVSGPPDLVLLDIGLPVMTGDMVLRELRSHGFERLPIVVATAGTNAERFLSRGATALLRKPYTLDGLLETVATHALNGREHMNGRAA